MDIDSVIKVGILEFANKILFEDRSRNVEDEECSIIVEQASVSEETIRVINYVKNIVPLYSEVDFKLHFRMGRTTFETLLETVPPLLIKAKGRPVTNPVKQLLCAIWVLSTPDSFRSIGDRFDLPKSGVLHALQNVCAILNVLSREVIKMPDMDELPYVAEQFNVRTNFPGVIGAIDGTHIPIKAPHNYPEKYFNRKKCHSIVLQAVCNNNLLFMDCMCGYPGSVHDSRVFRNSNMHTMITAGDLPEQCHLLGDSAYPLYKNLIVPYKNNGHLSAEKRHFNFKLSQTRIIVEKAFGLLKQRFRRLKYFEFDKTEAISSYVLSACVLHNFCIRNSDPFEEPLEADEHIDISDDQLS